MNSLKSKFLVTISGEVRNHAGALLKILPEAPANSFVQQFIDLLYRHFSSASFVAKRITGADSDYQESAYTFNCAATVGEDEWGIVIGDDDTPVSMADFVLLGPLTTDIVFSSVTVSEPVTDGTKRCFDVVRTFTNNTGATLSIKEVGLYCYGASASNFHCIDRTLYAVDVNSGASLSLRYRISISV